MAKEKLKVLCVEDEVDIRENIAEILRDEGYEVHEADNGKSGFEKFLQTNPDLVISDIKMPELDGFSFLKLVRENRNVRNNTTPFIFLSALGARENVLKGIELTANDYLLKPIDFELLMAKVKEKVSNANNINLRHQRVINNLKKQVSVVLPNDIFTYLDVVSQTAKSLQDEPYGPLPHRNYINDFSKIYINSLKIRAVIFNALDQEIIDERLNANESVYSCYDLINQFTLGFSEKLQARIEIEEVNSKESMPKIKCDRFVIYEALRKIMSQFLKIADDTHINIRFIVDHRQQLVMIFYVKSEKLIHENANLKEMVNENEIQKILDKQSCRFEIDLNHKDTALLSFPSHRVVGL